MAWQRSGDNAATYPPLMATAALSTADERTVNEVAGFLWRCSTQSAGHMTDYCIDLGTIALMGGSRWKTLVAQSVKTGLLTRLPARQGYKLVEDPEFIHIRLREAVLRDRARDRDRKNPDLTMPVLARDGDQCRYCGLVCNGPSDQKSNKRREFDARDRHDATTVDTYVVACKGCNRRRDALRTEGLTLEQMDAAMPLRPAPARPYYHPKTAERLEEYFGRSFTTEPGSAVDRRSIADDRSGTRVGTGRGRVGSGREGSGEGLDGTGGDARPHKRTRRSRRGGRKPGGEQ